MSIAGEIALPGKDPDAILYDKFSNRVFTFNGGGTQDASAIDAITGKVVGTVALGGKPEFAQTDLNGHIYVNIEEERDRRLRCEDTPIPAPLAPRSLRTARWAGY